VLITSPALLKLYLMALKDNGQKVTNYNIDLTNQEATHSIFEQHKDIVGVIHFAAFKAVGESVENPLKYYHNNVGSLTSILKCVEKFNVPYFVFSSSCTVYGNPDSVCVTEEKHHKKSRISVWLHQCRLVKELCKIL